MFNADLSTLASILSVNQHHQTTMIPCGPEQVSREFLSASSQILPDFQKKNYQHILWKIRNKLVTKQYHHALTVSLNYLVKYEFPQIVIYVCRR